MSPHVNSGSRIRFFNSYFDMMYKRLASIGKIRFFGAVELSRYVGKTVSVLFYQFFTVPLQFTLPKTLPFEENFVTNVGMGYVGSWRNKQHGIKFVCFQLISVQSCQFLKSFAKVSVRKNVSVLPSLTEILELLKSLVQPIFGGRFLEG